MEATKIKYSFNKKMILQKCSTSTSGKDNLMEPFLVMLDKVKEHIWRDFGPFFYADPDPFFYTDPCKILHILEFALINYLLQFSLQVSNWINVRHQRWPLQSPAVSDLFSIEIEMHKRDVRHTHGEI